MNLILKDDNYITNNPEQSSAKTWDDVEIIVDPELEDESTVEIDNYLNKYILQCRICGNMFPSKELLKGEDKCPICGSVSPNGFIYKGKLLRKKTNINKSTNDGIEQINDSDFSTADSEF